MNAHRMDQETVERLLGGSVADALDGPAVLVQLLAAVRAAPQPHELSGEAAALQAFRMARAGSVPVVASRPERRLLTGLLGVKMALAALLAAGTGGVALAAVTGTLPGPLGSDEPTTTASAGAGGNLSPTADPVGSPTPAAGPTDRPGSLAALTGLCAAYQAQPGADRRGSLETARFADLVVAAGGREKVPAFCNRLRDRRDPQGGQSAGPTKRPSPESTNRPEHAPSTPAGTVASTTGPADPTLNRPAMVGPSPR
ncbi:hypothetical protein [Micromonospora sp. NPDC005806]|uniref:hypothetical protein n=1 Tax=Micromonospora sp. NPDC005806 TaxID=3364234 RepID=UPI00369876BB